MLSGNVLLTGGSGFLGRAILRRAEREQWPAKFTVYSRDEEKQWNLKRRWPNVRCVLGDVARDFERLISVCSGHDTVIHMGAVKFIPEAEYNVLETIDVNVTGSRNVGLAAITAGVETVVGISTDKACSPANTYGITKAIMERMYGELDRMSDTNFVTARYGNVVGSTGSVIPVFRLQIKDKKQISVTDSRMTRFWMSVDQAIDLILWAHGMSDTYSGHTFISRCPAMTIDEIAKTVWKMETGGDDADIIYIGTRPGEKLHEALFNEQEAPRVACVEQGFVMRPAIQSAWSTIPERMVYESNHPDYWITREEMANNILDAYNI